MALFTDSLCDTGLQSSDFTACFLPVDGFPVGAVGGGRTSQSCDCRHLLSLPRKILQTISKWSTGVGRQLPFGPGDVATRIRPITGRHSLFPASYSRTSNSVPCGFTCPNAPGRKYGVSTFRLQKYVGLGACSRPEDMWITKAYLKDAVPIFITVLVQA